jgi:REP element-mobilizing transposase RayT
MPNHCHGILIIDPDVGNGRNRSLPKIKPLFELIGAFKTTSSKKIHEAGLREFKWQKSFYDHVIRNDKSLYRIRKYIINNPLKWEYDQENFNNISKREKKIFWKEFLR